MDCGIGSAANRRRIVSLKFHLVLVVGSFPRITYVNLDYYGTTSELKMTNKKEGSLALCAHPWITENREFPLERGCHGSEPVTPTLLTANHSETVLPSICTTVGPPFPTVTPFRVFFMSSMVGEPIPDRLDERSLAASSTVVCVTRRGMPLLF